MNTNYWIFPGQASVKPGMGIDLLRTSVGRQRLKEAEEILGWKVQEVWEGNDKRLLSTLYNQPSFFTFTDILVDLFNEIGIFPGTVSGVSLGQYSALYAAQVFDFTEGLQLIKRRGEIMSGAPSGAMIVLIAPKNLEEAMENTSDVWIANDDTQKIMLSGRTQSIEQMLGKVRASRVIRLSPQKPFHTPLMREVAADFAGVLEKTSFKYPKAQLLASDGVVENIGALKQSLIEEISSPIRLKDLTLKIVSAGIKRVVEIGPKKTLVSQMRRLCPELGFAAINTATDVWLQQLEQQVKELELAVKFNCTKHRQQVKVA